MANIKISELNELEQVDNDDLLVIVDTSSNETKKVKARNVGTGGGGSEVVIIDDKQPTSEFNKLWIDTGEVQNLGSEITNEYSESTGVGYSANYINNLNTYSTTETKIGTYNGKILYSKIFTGTTNSSDGLTPITTGIDNIVDYGGKITNAAGTQFSIPDSNTTGTQFARMIKLASNNTARLDVGTDLLGLSFELWIKYTKTTD